MDLGEKLRELRREKNLTQPELAERLGIEQSYLSKLENGKSLPSSEVLGRILEAFSLPMADLLSDLDPGVRNQLSQIPEVATHVRARRRLALGDQRRWLFSSSAAIALGAALIYAGYAHLFVSDFIYSYESPGVIRDGESKAIFEMFSIHAIDSPGYQELRPRADERYLAMRNYRGEVFNEPVAGGSRTYYLQRKSEVDPWQNKAVTFVGVLLGMAGVLGLLLERRLSLAGLESS